MSTKPDYLKVDFPKDLIASLVGFLVCIPMNLGIAIGSGLPPEMGLVSGIIGNLILGLATTATLMITGPAAGLIAITFETVNRFGIEKLGAIVLLAGIIQIVVGLLRIGQLFRAITPAVIHGMMAGIGLIIIFSQFHIMFDIKPTGKAFLNLIHVPATLQTAMSSATNLHAAIIGLVTIGILMAFRFFPPIMKKLPSSLYGIAGGTIASAMMHFVDIKHIQLPHNFLGSIHLIPMSSLGTLIDGQAIMAAVAICFIASAKALLTASATESMHDGERTENNKEILVQGAGNILCGLVGSIPLSGEILRSTVNVHSGARSRFALIMMGLWLLLFLMFFPQTLEVIPVACLAGLLVFTGFQLLGIKHIKELAHFGRAEVAIFVITALSVAFVDVLEGVIWGMVLGLINLCLRLSDLLVELDGEVVAEIQKVKLQGKGSFINVPKLASTLEKLHPGKKVEVNIDNLNFVDNAFYEYLESWQKGYSVTGGQISLEWDKLKDMLMSGTPGSASSHTAQKKMAIR